MQAQAERERRARVILADSERQIAQKFSEAAATYANTPTAFHLCAMNMPYEGLKQNSTIVIVPGTPAESMQIGGIAGLTALTMGLKQPSVNKPLAAERVPQVQRYASQKAVKDRVLCCKHRVRQSTINWT